VKHSRITSLSLFPVLGTFHNVLLYSLRSEVRHYDDTGRKESDCTTGKTGAPAKVQVQPIRPIRVPHLPRRPVSHSLPAQAQVLTRVAPSDRHASLGKAIERTCDHKSAHFHSHMCPRVRRCICFTTSTRQVLRNPRLPTF